MSEEAPSLTVSNGCHPAHEEAKDETHSHNSEFIPLSKQPEQHASSHRPLNAVNGVSNKEVSAKSEESSKETVEVGSDQFNTKSESQSQQEQQSEKSVKTNSDHRKDQVAKNKVSRELSAIINAISPTTEPDTDGHKQNGTSDVTANGDSKKRRQPKRANSTTSSNDDLEPRIGKRIRLQTQPFQSAIIPAYYSRSQPSTSSKDNPEDKLVVFNKGEFLAVRNEFGSFYVCRTAQNVYKSSRKFKIQWLNDDKDVYTPDFHDVTDFECVLTNLRMAVLSKGRYKLPPDEKKRVLNILERALNVEKGVTDIPDPLKVTEDGIDVSIVGKEEEKEVVQLVLAKEESTKKTQPTEVKPEKPSKVSVSKKSTKSSSKSLLKSTKEPSKDKKSSKKLAEVKTKKKVVEEPVEPRKAKSKVVDPPEPETKKSQRLPTAKVTPTLESNLSKLAKKNQELKKALVAKKNLKKGPPKNDVKTVQAKEVARPTRSSRITRPSSPRPPPPSKKVEAIPDVPSTSKPTRTAKVEAKKQSVKPVKVKEVKVKPPKVSSPTERKSSPVDVLQLIGLEAPAQPIQVADAKPEVKKSTLESAIRCGDDRTASECIKSGSGCREQLESLAFLAAGHCPQILSTLITNGVNVNLTDPSTGNTFLHVLAGIPKKSQVILSAARTLLTLGINVNQPNHSGKLAIHIAAAVALADTESITLLETLIDGGSNLSVADGDKRIPAFYAFIKNSKVDETTYYDPVEQVILLTRGVDIDYHRDRNGETVLHRAASRGATVSCMHLMRLMRQRDPLDGRQNTPLAFSVINGHESCSLSLINAGCNFCHSVNKPLREVAAGHVGPSQWTLDDGKKRSREESTILREIIEKNWHRARIFSVNHLSLFVSNFSFGIEATLQAKIRDRLRLAIQQLTRLPVQTFVDVKRLLILFAANCLPEDDHESQRKFLDILFKRGLDAIFIGDPTTHEAILRAAENHNHVLCEELTTKLGGDKVARQPQNLMGHTPLTAMTLKLDRRDLSRDMKSWAASLVSSGGTFNILAYYPIQPIPFPTVRYAAIDHGTHSLSPLMVAVLKGNYHVVKYLVQQKADINLKDEDGRTAIMIAARLNDLKMMKLLLHLRYDPETDTNPWSSRFLSFKQTSSADLTIRDKYGWTVVHHAVAPDASYSYQATNVIIRLLAQVGAPLTAPDSRGVTPLQLAHERGLSVVVETLQDPLLVPDLTSSPRLKVDSVPPFSATRTEIKVQRKLEAIPAAETRQMVGIVKADPLLGFGDSSQITMDTDNGVPLTSLLVRPSREELGQMDFFKLQIVCHKDRNIIVFFTRWGRVGDAGQYKKTTCSTEAEAVDQFKAMFRDKTGQEWEDAVKGQVKPVPDKYRFVQVDYATSGGKLDTTLTDKVTSYVMSKSSLDVGLVDLLKDLLLKCPQVTADMDSVSWTALTLEGLEAAQKILQDMKILIQEKDVELRTFSKKNKESAEKIVKILEQIVDLNGQLSNLMKGHKRLLLPMLDMDTCNKTSRWLNDVKKRLFYHLLSATYATQPMPNPMDFVYGFLKYHLRPVDRTSFEGELILRFVTRTPNVTVRSVYEVVGAVDQSPVTNPWLLFQEVDVEDILPILCGQPIPESDGLFGQGFYFTDCLKKLQPCRLSVISEVRLGNVQEVGVDDQPSKGISDSFKTKSAKWLPDPSQGIVWKGRNIPFGCLTETEVASPEFNSFLVKSSSQVNLRYLIVIDN